MSSMFSICDLSMDSNKFGKVNEAFLIFLCLIIDNSAQLQGFFRYLLLFLLFRVNDCWLWRDEWRDEDKDSAQLNPV